MTKPKASKKVAPGITGGKDPQIDSWTRADIAAKKRIAEREKRDGKS